VHGGRQLRAHRQQCAFAARAWWWRSLVALGRRQWGVAATARGEAAGICSSSTQGEMAARWIRKCCLTYLTNLVLR
jgi:hypothetical protein